jgi:YcxB-like protein
MDQTVTYRFGLDDYVALVRAVRQLGLLGLGHWGRNGFFTVVFGTAAIILFVTIEGVSMPFVLIFAAVLYGVTFAASLLIDAIAERPWFRRFYRRFSIADKDVTLHFGDELGVRFAGVELKIQWPSIRHLIETKTHLFLFLSRAEGIVVPLRAVGSREKLGELAGSIRARLATAQRS